MTYDTYCPICAADGTFDTDVIVEDGVIYSDCDHRLTLDDLDTLTPELECTCRPDSDLACPACVTYSASVYGEEIPY